MDHIKSDLKTLLRESCNYPHETDLSFASTGKNSDEKHLVDIANWIRFARIYLSQANTHMDALVDLDKALAHRTFLIGDTLTFADIAVWARLQCTSEWHNICDAAQQQVSSSKSGFVNVHRLCNFLSAKDELKPLAMALKNNCVPLVANPTIIASPSVPSQPSAGKQSAKDMKFEEGGKFEALPGAEMGKVVVRMPPEASGYMHIGHAKAALLNQHYRDIFKGRLILRFDDTNPSKETVEFEEAIMADLPHIGFKWDTLSYSSDHFGRILDLCTQMIKDGHAYADDTDAETMKAEREQRKESSCRSNSVDKNLAWWKEMQEGTPHGQKTCIRAKIDMSSDNGCLRDPTIYRCKAEPHIRTGSTYKVYPTYDFACPIVDSVEGVTHALRTSEYNDRNDQYYWMCDALKIRKPRVIDYSRLALQSTILSKRKLTWFVEQGLVTGWDDPRMPTVRGILRHGLTPEGLRQFILAQGSSRSTGTMEWDKIWAFNKKVIDPLAPRYTGLNLDGKKGLVSVRVQGQTVAETKKTPLHPKDASIGEKTIVLAPTVFVEHADAECFNEGENVTFVNWGNLKIVKVLKSPDGKVTSVDAELNLADTDFKKTQKVTWLADPAHAKNLSKDLTELTPLACLTYGPLISKPLLGKEESFTDFINKESLVEECFFGDPQLRGLKKGDIIQLTRKGFYICDQPFTNNQSVEESSSKTNSWSFSGLLLRPLSWIASAAHSLVADRLVPATGKEGPCVLIYIPDGATKARPTTGSKFKAGETGDKAKPEVSQKPKGKAGAATAGTDLTPEEAAKRAEKERLKEEKKAARKAGREKAKAQEAGPAKPGAPATGTGDVTAAPTSSPIVPVSAAKTEAGAPPKKQQEKSKKEKKPTVEGKQGKAQPAKTDSKKQTRLGLEAKKDEDTAEWYTQVITKAELLEYYDISGCYILRPWSYFIWSQIQQYTDKVIAGYGVDNTYFPMFVSKNALEQEKEHIADFAPEVAWVTKSGSSDMAEPIAIRPTSETIMYPAFAKWIKSHRDLPLKINQWSNIVRWEFKHPTPFLRTREFLWQEGHTAFASREEAVVEVMQILDLYRDIYRDLLAIPGVKGKKTEREKFPGGDFTTTVEVYIGASGRAIQGATSHHLGQNFSKIFNVVFEHPETKQACHVFQNSWGITTRTIGVMIMVHSDNQGLVLPPRVAKYQVVVVPCGITAKTTDAERAQLVAKAKEVTESLRKASDLRVHLDDRDHVSPGWKFNHWELKGVPVRLEIGFKDMAASQVTAVIRYTGEKRAMPMANLSASVPALLDEIHETMLTRAMEQQLSHIVPVKDMNGLAAALEKKCLVLAPFCGAPACEDCIRDESSKNVVAAPGAPSMGAKSLCVPFENELPGLKTGPVVDNSQCIRYPLCKEKATFYTLFGRSY